MIYSVLNRLPTPEVIEIELRELPPEFKGALASRQPLLRPSGNGHNVRAGSSPQVARVDDPRASPFALFA